MKYKKIEIGCWEEIIFKGRVLELGVKLAQVYEEMKAEKDFFENHPEQVVQRLETEKEEFHVEEEFPKKCETRLIKHGISLVSNFWMEEGDMHLSILISMHECGPSMEYRSNYLTISALEKLIHPNVVPYLLKIIMDEYINKML